MRLDKFLSNMGRGSRSEIKKMIARGRVRVNGQVTKKVISVLPQSDQIHIDHELVESEPHIYIMLNKPSDYITARQDHQHKTVMDILGTTYGNRVLFPVGRLDKDTEGFLIITDDGDFNHSIMSPKKHVSKTYYAKVLGQPNSDTIDLFSQGLDIGELCKPAELKILSSGKVSEIELTITEGKFHQVKRMFEAVNMKVVYLKRIAIGSLDLDEDLALGEFRKMTHEECLRIKSETL